MENYTGLVSEDDQLELPPGFRFHPTDEELITHYLCKKVVDINFSVRAVGEVDMNRVEPWELPWVAKMGEKEWYFFCVRDKKYKTGIRTNRATKAGYWKATGKDKEIIKGKSVVGMKKTLVFYRGRAPKGEKTNWVTHEYRLEGKSSLYSLPNSDKNDWVIARVFQKTVGGKKLHISGIRQSNSPVNEMIPSVLPSLMDSPPLLGSTKFMSTPPEPRHVPCFSSSISVHNQQDVFNSCFNHPPFPTASNSLDILPRGTFSDGLSWGNSATFQSNYQFPGTNPMQENQGFLRSLLENCGGNMKQSLKTEETRFSGSQETSLTTDINNEISSVLSNLEMGRKPLEDHEGRYASIGPQGLDYFWNY